jgi:hypothetical protein
MLLVVMHELNIFDRRNFQLIDRGLDHLADGIFIARIQITHYLFYQFIGGMVEPQTQADLG